MKDFFITTALLTLTLSAHADWLNFRGPQGSGYAPEISDLPETLAESTTAWKVALPGRGLGSPLLIGDRVYLTAASGPEQKQLHILCFNAADGSPVWERKFWATGRTMSHNKTNVAAPTPASDGERIYALFSSNDLICVDLDGNVKWMRGLTLDYPNASNSLGMASSPIVAGDTLVAQIENDSESFAAGFDLLTGVNKWKIDRPKAANWTSPTVLEIGEEKVVCLQSSKGILGVVPSTGSSVFTFGGGASTIPSSAAVGDRLYIPSNGLTAITATTDGADPKKMWNESAQRPGTASPLVIGEKVYTINNAGVLSCADRSSGERIWRTRLKGPMSGSPVAGENGLLYIFNEAGVGQVVDLSGEEGKIISEIELEETILSTPSLSTGALYIRSDKHLWKFAN
ncbi:MAG: pyrrolo-quinoline quinone [Verrucomicrobiales bacterium]|nr:pyrrolo-quinoline quinone [Verrucomicrobiales bacterium]